MSKTALCLSFIWVVGPTVSPFLIDLYSFSPTVASETMFGVMLCRKTCTNRGRCIPVICSLSLYCIHLLVFQFSYREKTLVSRYCVLLKPSSRRRMLRWVYTSDAVKRFVALSRASQMRMKALAAYLFILPTPASARINTRQKAWRGARKMLQSSTVLNFRASRQQFSQSCTGVTN